jgi:hypothetical protein
MCTGHQGSLSLAAGLRPTSHAAPGYQGSSGARGMQRTNQVSIGGFTRIHNRGPIFNKLSFTFTVDFLVTRHALCKI